MVTRLHAAQFQEAYDLLALMQTCSSGEVASTLARTPTWLLIDAMYIADNTTPAAVRLIHSELHSRHEYRMLGGESFANVNPNNN